MAKLLSTLSLDERNVRVQQMDRNLAWSSPIWAGQIMASTTTRLMTAAESSALPEGDGPVYPELRHGEVVAVIRPIYYHYKLQQRLRRLLENLAPEDAEVSTEFAYRPLPEHELWIADVVYISPEREREIDLRGYLNGAPDIVIEVLSPSNTVAEMYEKEQLCLENGAKESWVVDLDRRQVRIATSDGPSRTWISGQEIPLPLLGGAEIAVDAIFRLTNR
jgi:Uma2 family endonuclease